MTNHPVITVAEAKQITGGRTPGFPVEYESAVKALAACVSLDEAKYWSDKADALAAWAKIYRSKDAEVQAKRLRLHAFRRMGELARELRPLNTQRRDKPGKGPAPGPRSLLMDQGFSQTEAAVIGRVASTKQADFDRAISHPNPPSPYTLIHSLMPASGWYILERGISQVLRAQKQLGAQQIARQLLDSKNTDVERARRILREAADFLSEVELGLQVGKGG